MIRFDQVWVAVATPAGTKYLLKEVNLELTERRIAVIGANGSGKSTLLRLINGLVEPSRGTVKVNDHLTTEAIVRRQVGFVFTDPAAQLLMPTPLEDVELSLGRVTKDRSVRRQQARQLLAEWGLEAVASQSVYDLSGGERQLAALVSVLAVEPQIIVADEPTTLLDLRHSRQLAAAFGALSQQVVVATHDLDWAAGFERVLVIADGGVVADGEPAAAIAHYRRLAGG